MADGSNFARMFACNVGCVDIEVDLAMVFTNVPADVTKSLIFEAGAFDTTNGTVNLIWNSRFREYAVNKSKSNIVNAERSGFVVEGAPFEATSMLEWLSHFQLSSNIKEYLNMVASLSSTKVTYVSLCSRPTISFQFYLLFYFLSDVI